MEKLTIFWMRRDLRLHDNTALFEALKVNRNVLVLFIFDKNILSNPTDPRITFIYNKIQELKTSLESAGSSLLILHDTPLNAFKTLINCYTVSSVYFNHDYEPYAVSRDTEVGAFLRGNGIEVFSFKDQVIFEKDEVCKPDGKPYHVFTPYSVKWKEKLKLAPIKSAYSEMYFANLWKSGTFQQPSLNGLGFGLNNMSFPPAEINLEILRNYHQTRNIPALQGTSLLGLHLRFGTVSIRDLVDNALSTNETFLNELIWRDFFMMILWHYPETVTHSFKPLYTNIKWRNNEKEFELWCEGKTGYPIVDAGMRQLNSTGFMHNRVRMITASFLVKHLLIDWRWGEAYFAEKLLDYEQSSNVGNWQWVVGSGCDAAPYFRIFNPVAQAKKFDPEEKYIRQWIKEYHTEQYPSPVVIHSEARARALQVYKTALNQKDSML